MSILQKVYDTTYALGDATIKATKQAIKTHNQLAKQAHENFEKRRKEQEATAAIQAEAEAHRRRELYQQLKREFES